MRIQIIGFSGSGKSTLAKSLAEYFKLNLLHLDTVQFHGNWEVRDYQEQVEIVRDFLSNNEEWVIDGNYSKIVNERFSLSDMTIYLKFNRFACYYRCLKRFLKNRNKTRDCLGCKEKFDLEFQKWILFNGRTKAIKQRHDQNLSLCQGRKIVLKNQRQVRKFMKEVVKGEI
jgi:adenylate kinase family enzyme